MPTEETVAMELGLEVSEDSRLGVGDADESDDGDGASDLGKEAGVECIWFKTSA